MYIVVFSFYTYFKSYSKIMELENRNSLFNTTGTVCLYTENGADCFSHDFLCCSVL